MFLDQVLVNEEDLKYLMIFHLITSLRFSTCLQRLYIFEVEKDESVLLSQDQCPRTTKEKDSKKSILYALAVGNFMYVMLCIRPDIYFTIGFVSRY